MQDCKQALRCKLAKIVALKGLAGFAEEFDAAQGATAERVDVTGPASHGAGDRVADIGRHEIGIQLLRFRHGDAREPYADGPMTPSIVPVRFRFAEVRPIGMLGVIARVFKRNALDSRICEFLAARRLR